MRRCSICRDLEREQDQARLNEHTAIYRISYPLLYLALYMPISLGMEWIQDDRTSPSVHLFFSIMGVHMIEYLLITGLALIRWHTVYLGAAPFLTRSLLMSLLIYILGALMASAIFADWDTTAHLLIGIVVVIGTIGAGLLIWWLLRGCGRASNNVVAIPRPQNQLQPSPVTEPASELSSVREALEPIA